MRESIHDILLLALLVPALAEFRFPSGSHLQDLRWEILCLAISLVVLSILWAALFGSTAVAYMVLRTLKHRTKLLHVDRSQITMNEKE